MNQRREIPTQDSSLFAYLEAKRHDRFVLEDLGVELDLSILTARELDVVIMHGMANMTLTDVADELGIADSTARGYWHTARRKLRDCLPLDPKEQT